MNTIKQKVQKRFSFVVLAALLMVTAGYLSHPTLRKVFLYQFKNPLSVFNPEKHGKYLADYKEYHALTAFVGISVAGGLYGLYKWSKDSSETEE